MERCVRWSLVAAGCLYAAAVGGSAQTAARVTPAAQPEAGQRTDRPGPPGAVDDAVRRSLTLLQASARTWSERRDCASCHHQSLGTLTVEVARERGYAVDADAAQAQAAFTARTRDEAVSLDTYVRGQGPVGGGNMGLSYALTSLTSVGWPASRVTDVLAHFVSSRQVPDGRFPSPDHRPPHEDSQVAATALAIRALLAYGRDRTQVSGRVARAASWLESASAETTEDRTMQLLGLRWAGRGALIDKLQAALLQMQREDGGWSQLPTRASDAYATGQVLVALNQTGVAAQSTAYRRGVAFLIGSQQADGSWRVQTRRKDEVEPGQEYFESGFPHGRDQFISYAGSAWATMALCLTRSSGASKALTDTTARARRSPEEDEGWTEGTTPLMKAALFGPPEALTVLLDAGANVNTANAEGTTALMWAATRGPLPVELLIARGANAKVADARGWTPLMLAAGAGQLDVMRALIAAGADVNALSSHGWSALRDAVRSGITPPSACCWTVARSCSSPLATRTG